MNAAAPGSTTASTAVRIVSISAAQNKRGKDCYEGGMGAGHFTWYKDCLLYTSPSPRDS